MILKFTGLSRLFRFGGDSAADWIDFDSDAAFEAEVNNFLSGFLFLCSVAGDFHIPRIAIKPALSTKYRNSEP